MLRSLTLLRRGLRQVPNHPELLAVLKETQAQIEALDAGRTRRRVLNAQVREGLDLLAEGRTDDSLRVLRGVLLEDPDNGRAQAAIQDVRRTVVSRRGAKRRAPAAPPVPAEPPPPAPVPPNPVAAPAPRATPPATRPDRDRVADPALPAVPVEILLPRTLRKATPLRWIVAGGVLILGLVAFLVSSGRSGQAPIVVSSPSAAPVSLVPNAAAPEAGPLDGVPPELRTAVEDTLARYARALESVDATLLASVRPDMNANQREARLAPFRGALNATSDLRVIEAHVQGTRAEVEVLATDVVIGGQGAPRPPMSETLIFERGAAGWGIVPR